VTEDAVQTLIAGIAAWVSARPDLKALAVVGSWARGTARPDSDLDLVILATDLQRYRADQTWLGDLTLPKPYRVASWRSADYGTAWSCHVGLAPSAELEITFCNPAWVCTDPIDNGTRRVVTAGFRIILDREQRLARLREAIEETGEAHGKTR